MKQWNKVVFIFETANMIDDEEGVETLREVLKSNKTLTKLSINSDNERNKWNEEW